MWLVLTNQSAVLWYYKICLISCSDKIDFQIGLIRGSVTRLGDFWKFICNKFLSKVAKILSDILSYFEKHYLFKYKLLWQFLGNFLQIWANFYSTPDLATLKDIKY